MGLAPVNTIIVIESLGSDDRKTGKELYDDVIVRYNEYFHSTAKQSLITRYYAINNKSEFLELLNVIALESSSYASGVLIHIETHGSDDRSGMVLYNGEKLIWGEVQDVMIRINVNTNNQLYLSMATCFGVYIHETMDHKKRAPFCAFISALKKVTENEIIEFFEPFFRELINSRDAIEAIKKNQINNSNFYYKDAEEIYKQIIKGIRVQLDNPQFKKKYLQDALQEYMNTIPNAPKVSEEEADILLKKAFDEQIDQIRKVFLFGKERKKYN